MEPLPLTEEDRAILALESATVAGHTCKVIRLEAPGTGLAALRERIDSRLEQDSLLRARLDAGREIPAWVGDPGFAIDRHVVRAPGVPEAGLDPEGVCGLVARLFAEHLDRERPLWRLDLAGLEDGGSLLVWRVHHALADGTTCMRLARDFLWDGDEAKPAPAARPHRVAQEHADHERRRGHLGRMLAREFAESPHHSPFDGEIGRRREVAFATVSLGPLHDAAKGLCRASVNDAVLTLVAGGLRTWLESAGESARTFRFKVPVSLHHEGDDAGNRDSFFTLPVHLEEADPVLRLAAVREATAERKREHDAERIESLDEAAGRHGPALSSLLNRLESSPRRFALCVSNVPGPREAVALAGARVRSMHSLAEVGRRHGLRVAVVSLAGELHFGICADPALVGDLAPMVAGIEADATELVATASRG